MIKTIGIVSLSSGTIGEEKVRFEVEIGIKRLEAMGLEDAAESAPEASESDDETI